MRLTRKKKKNHIKTSPSELQRSRWVLDHCSGNSSRRDRDSWRAMSRTFSVFPPSFGHRSSPTGTGDCCCSGEEAVGDCALTGSTGKRAGGDQVTNPGIHDLIESPRIGVAHPHKEFDGADASFAFPPCLLFLH